MGKVHNDQPSLNDSLERKIASLPSEPGIYKMLGANQTILYIGKAKNLSHRVRSYFTGRTERLLITYLVHRIEDVEVIVTPTERDALLLENNLIKEHQPYFNIDLKDAKSYPYIRLTSHERFPRIYKTRERVKGGEYFGPYTDLSKMYLLIDLINDLYPLKKCRQRRFPKGFKPCMYFHIDKCLPYCTGKVSKKEIADLNESARKILKGGVDGVKKIIEEKMHLAKDKQYFEVALAHRRQLENLEGISEKQQVQLDLEQNFDVFNYHLSDTAIIFVVLNFRDGNLIDKQSYPFEKKIFEEDWEDACFSPYFQELFNSFLLQYYHEVIEPIREIFTPFVLESKEEVQEILIQRYAKQTQSEINPKYFEFTTPLQGQKKNLLDLAKANARLSYQELLKVKEKATYPQELKKILKLKKAPQSIESFDIANTGDNAILAGMVRFVKGKRDSQNYRIFNIKSTAFQDDFISMREAVYRRYRRLLDEKKPFPDLILIDGGKGQLSAAAESLKVLGIKGQPIISIAKKEEKIYVPKQSDPLSISLDNPALKYLIEVRDETHRWANTSHKHRRDKEAFSSLLDNIPGLGEKKIKTLYAKFKNVEDIFYASKESILALPFFGEKDFDHIKSYLGNIKIRKQDKGF